MIRGKKQATFRQYWGLNVRQREHMVEDLEKRESYSKKLPPHRWEGASRGEVVQEGRIH